MATIEKRKGKTGNISYRALVRIKGFPVQSKTFSQYTKAQEWAKRTEIGIKDGRYFPNAESNRRTVADLIEKFKAEELPKKRNRDKSIYNQLAVWKSIIGQYALSAIKTDVLTAAINKIYAMPTPHNGKKSPATMNRYIAALSVVFSYGYKSLDWLTCNPMEKIRKYTEPRGRTRFLSEDERNRLLEACQASTNPLLYPAVLLGIISGARKNEILSLKWTDVDLYLDDDKGQGILKDTKNGEERTMIIVGPALHVLRKMEQNKANHDHIFYAVRNDSKSGHANINHAWYEALEKSGIPDFRFHDLRHTTASYLAQNHASLHEIGLVLGHKTVQATKRYAHLTNSHQMKLVDKVTKKIFS